MPITLKAAPNQDSQNPLRGDLYGAVYLHGCMHGEALTDLDTGGC